jgi:Mg/Co/Ni transporter MgtE
MYTRKVERLPVVDGDGRLTGIISRADVLSVFDRSDDEIRGEIAGGVILDEFLVEPVQGVVAVRDRLSYFPPKGRQG